jgi:hypothetical protein
MGLEDADGGRSAKSFFEGSGLTRDSRVMVIADSMAAVETCPTLRVHPASLSFCGA